MYDDIISIVVGGRRSTSEREAKGGIYRCRTEESERKRRQRKCNENRVTEKRYERYEI